MRTIKLNALEMGVAYSVAMMRAGANEVCRVPVTKVSERSIFQINLTGACAEIGFVRAYNVRPDFTIGPRKGGCDFIVNGITIDIKATDHPEGNLICPPNGNEKSMLYFLAVVRGDVVTLVGYATAEELFQPGNLIALYPGGPPTYRVPRAALHSMDEFERGLVRERDAEFL